MSIMNKGRLLMINRILISNPHPFPMVLRYTDIRSYIFTAVFISLAVLVPWVFHQFRLAGPTFLPMHIFVLMAGLIFGWRAGLIVGLFTPIISHLTSGMPVMSVLPQITVELVAYGSISGMLREKFNLRTIWSLIGAMIGGRLALLLAILTIYIITGESYSPLGGESSPFLALWSVIRQGWPGIIIQLVSIPSIVWMTGRFLGKSQNKQL